jgi:hypothetical protein
LLFFEKFFFFMNEKLNSLITFWLKTTTHKKMKKHLFCLEFSEKNTTILYNFTKKIQKNLYLLNFYFFKKILFKKDSKFLSVFFYAKKNEKNFESFLNK